MVEMMPQEMRAGIAPYILADENSVEYSLVKAADKFAAYIKCLEELRSGNNEFAKAKKTIEEDLHARNMPAVEYFFKHFVEAFSLTLDELECL
jgi:5'-deoxynucleotidase